MGDANIIRLLGICREKGRGKGLLFSLSPLTFTLFPTFAKSLLNWRETSERLFNNSSLFPQCLLPKNKVFNHSKLWRFWQSLQKLIQLRVNYIRMHKAIIIQNPKLKVA
ncbi:MAG: hypothetical protein RM368_16860 [Nostoc sp. DedSLP03]|uniref:hypothetical protein n=1 Tax=Nostoc sp. DedSLP03 TaxID=3075400 RepID=UPI002AD5A957|nr:hypothetical protein [Nostoc sp. DedSLP03]MDZ7966620.1 hypothetical protein [Nostoc sp. DedSLP03]